MEQSRHGEGITSVKVHHQPGGQQQHNIFGGDPEADKDRFGARQNNNAVPAAVKPQEVTEKPGAQAAVNNNEESKEPAGKISVKVHAPPGGKSQITFG